MPLIDDRFLEDLRQKLAVDKTVYQEDSPLDASSQIYKKIIRLVGIRDRSVEELRKRFVQEEFEESAIDQALEKALACGLLDDERFAAALVRTRLAADKGMRGIELELERNGINVYEHDRVLGEIFPSEGEEGERALRLLRRKPPQSKNKRDGAYRKLVSKGFSSEIAASAAHKWSREIS